MGIQVQVKKWGNSLGVLIPNEAVKKLNLKKGDFVDLNIKKSGNVLKELFGTIKFDESTEKMLKEDREESKSKFE